MAKVRNEHTGCANDNPVHSRGVPPVGASPGTIDGYCLDREQKMALADLWDWAEQSLNISIDLSGPPKFSRS